MKCNSTILSIFLLVFFVLNCAKEINPLEALTTSENISAQSQNDLILQAEILTVHDSIIALEAAMNDTTMTPSQTEELKNIISEQKAQFNELIQSYFLHQDSNVTVAIHNYDQTLLNNGTPEERKVALDAVTAAKAEQTEAQSFISQLTISVDEFISSNVRTYSSENSIPSSNSESLPQSIEAGEPNASSLTSEPLSSVLAVLQSSVVYISSQINSSSTPIVSSRTPLSSSSTVIINTAPTIDQGPTLTLTTNEDSTITSTLSAIDIENDQLQWAIAKSATMGVASISGIGNSKVVTYTPPADSSGVALFSIAVSDGNLIDTIEITATIVSINDEPVFDGQSSITGAPHDKGVLAVSLSSCTDPHDTSIAPTLSYTWLSDADSIGYNGSVLVGAPLSLDYTVLPSDIHQFLYSIVSCTDADGVTIKDTTEYTERVRASYNLNRQAGVGGTVTDAGTHVVADLNVTTITATPDAAYGFVTWVKASGTGIVSWGDSTQSSTTISITGGDVVIQATFELDVTPPSVPAGLTSVQMINTEFDFMWSASTDAVRVAGYNVYNNGIKIDSVGGLSKTFSNQTFNAFTVSACDAAGNESAQSKTLYHIETNSRDAFWDITYLDHENYNFASDLDDDSGVARDTSAWNDRDIAGGTYRLKMRFSSTQSKYPNGIKLYFDDADTESESAKLGYKGNTGGIYNWVITTDTENFSITGGTHMIRTEFFGVDWNLDWFEFIPQ